MRTADEMLALLTDLRRHLDRQDEATFVRAVDWAHNHIIMLEARSEKQADMIRTIDPLYR